MTHLCEADPRCSVEISGRMWNTDEYLGWFGGTRTAYPTWWTYYLYADRRKERLLYVGFTSVFLERMYYHGKSSPWVGQVALIRMVAWCCKQKALTDEAAAIHVLSPIKNIQHNLTRIAGKPVAGCRICADAAEGVTG